MSAQLGATFIPGADDDYFMPEVVAPSPQRVTPQVPLNMQEGVHRMELEASSIEPSSNTSDQSYSRQREPSLSSYISPNNNTTSSGSTPAPRQPTPPAASESDPNIRAYQQDKSGLSDRLDKMKWDSPSFSPFPKVKGDNVPPADEEKEEILWNARKHVLHSQNVPMQIIWARDVLSWAEISQDAAVRDAAVANKPRPATPRAEHELRLDAINIIEYLAGQDHPEALYLRSKWLEFGKFGNRVDKREAYNGYRRAAELGNARSEYRMGMLFEQSNDMSRAKEHYYKGLALQDSAAMYRMGMMSLLGQHGESKDYPRGLERIQVAADSADEDAPQGAYVYGMIIGKDLPDINIPEGLVPHNLETAKVYVEKSAYLGFGKAQLKMGQAYELCQMNCDFNPAYSLHYYGLAAKQGLPEAALGVSRWFLFGYEGVFKKNEELAFKYAEEAAIAKLSTGAFALGYYYEIGIHVNKSINEAKRWYQIAADQGNQDAVGRLESLGHDQSLSKKDHETTTLTRIKSQHGSQRGKRPDRFKNIKDNEHLPTLDESLISPEDTGPPKLSLPGIEKQSPRVSPHPSPGMQPTIVEDHADFPDPARASIINSDRPPAFTIRLDPAQRGPVPRPQSAAPYPDDRPVPLNVSRPKSTAPYPDDDVQGGRPGPGNHGRPLQGPPADRPGSAFGIAPQGAQGGRLVPGSQSMGNLKPPIHADPRGRVASWSDGPGRQRPPPDPRGGQPSYYGPDGQMPGGGARRPVSAAPAPYPGDGNRIQKPPPKGYPQGGPRPGSIPPAGTNPAQGYVGGGGGGGPGPGPGPGPGSRQPGAPPPTQQDYARNPRGPPPGRDDRTAPPDPRLAPSQSHDRLGPRRPAENVNDRPRPDSRGDLPSQGGPLKPNPGMSGSNRPILNQPPPLGHNGSFPPSGGPGQGQQGRPSPQPGTPLASPPVSKPSKGPATFEDMGIPQGKQDSDCILM